MAIAFNQYICAGNLVREIGIKVIGDNTIGETAIAITESKKVKGEWVDDTQFFDITLFGGLAERCAKNLNKGDSVMVSGRLQTDRWEKEGVKHSKVKIIANDVRFLIFGKTREILKAASLENATAAVGDDAPF